MNDPIEVSALRDLLRNGNIDAEHHVVVKVKTLTFLLSKGDNLEYEARKKLGLDVAWQQRALIAEEEIAALKAKLNQYQDIHYNGLNYNSMGGKASVKSKQLCSKCGTALNIDPTVMLTSMPPQPSYYCPSCDKLTDERLKFIQQFKAVKL